MNEATLELQDKLVMFNGAATNIADKEAEMNRIAGKFKTNTNLMYAYELEKDKLAIRLAEAEYKIKELTTINEDQSSQIGMFSKHEVNRELSWVNEIKKNGELIARI